LVRVASGQLLDVEGDPLGKARKISGCLSDGATRRSSG